MVMSLIYISDEIIDSLRTCGVNSEVFFRHAIKRPPPIYPHNCPPNSTIKAIRTNTKNA